jgi:hypothetical protein
VFERNLRYQPVRGVDSLEECHWSHACKSFKRTGVGSNGILECKFLSENAHRTSSTKKVSSRQITNEMARIMWKPTNACHHTDGTNQCRSFTDVSDRSDRTLVGTPLQSPRRSLSNIFLWVLNMFSSLSCCDVINVVAEFMVSSSQCTPPCLAAFRGVTSLCLECAKFSRKPRTVHVAHNQTRDGSGSTKHLQCLDGNYSANR